jgi:signal transduction histidine kinase
MNVILISRDGDLYRLCREILAEFNGLDWQLVTATAADRPLDADLYIWDNPPKDLTVGGEQRFARHLFLVARNDAAQFCENLERAEAAILLKPVTRACLAAFLKLAASAFQESISAATSLRADRDAMLQCLIQSNLQLQEYDQDRTNFLARAVHDFRAPLTATNGYCGLLLSDALGPLTEEQREVVQRMQHSLKRLSRMASTMFELSVGRHVKRQPDLRKADIRECMEQALHEIGPFADRKSISLSVELDVEPGALYLEPGQIEQVLMNLLDNACKFTPKNGVIEIRGYPFFWERRSMRRTVAPAVERRYADSPSANCYRIDIRDSGPRIQREHLEKIFEEYTSYAGGQDRSGGGLGLAICRMIITAHEGRVWAENTEHGPRFSLLLPLRAAEPAGRASQAVGAAAADGRSFTADSVLGTVSSQLSAKTID